MPSKLIFCCGEGNDIYEAALASGLDVTRALNPMEALSSCEEGSALLVMADGYPDAPTDIDPGLYYEAAARRVRLYVEYPSIVPRVDAGNPRELEWERGVICSDVFGEALPKMRLVSPHRCRVLPMNAPGEVWIVAARVAGFDTAVFGLPGTSFPLLFEVEPTANPQESREAGSPSLLVAATKLSNAITARYAPTAAWKMIWERILDFLQPGVPHDLKWSARVRPAYSADDPLPPDYQRQAMAKGTKWFLNSRLLLNESRAAQIQRLLDTGTETVAVPNAEYARGDGRLGIQEGFCSSIDHNGDQTQRVPMRSDCNAESAMALAVDWWSNESSEESRRVAENLFDYVFFTSGMHSGPVRGNPEHPAFGLVSWGIGNRTWERAFYGDDDARVILSAIVGSACLGTDKYDENILRALMANLRTTGTKGFRGERVDIPDIERNGWKVYADSELVHPAPHFESYLWACNLWAYDKTGYEPFLQKARTAIGLTMECYPNWHWANGIAQERARMLLCLAWLVRVDDTPERREWVKRMADIVLANQEPCGAIREELGGGTSWAGAITSNEAYGTAEASLIQRNGDPVADTLYTCNFALLGLREAVAATGDPEIEIAEDRLAEFLCRIQVRSDSLPYLDGGWFRAFDYRQWDYWASSSDLGWGAWSIETGWTQAWITTVLGLREKGTSVWDLTSGARIEKRMDKVQRDLARNGGGPWKGEPWK